MLPRCSSFRPCGRMSMQPFFSHCLQSVTVIRLSHALPDLTDVVGPPILLLQDIYKLMLSCAVQHDVQLN